MFWLWLIDHKFDECPKMEKKIGIKTKKKNTDYNNADGENNRHSEISSSMKELESWIEV